MSAPSLRASGRFGELFAHYSGQRLSHIFDEALDAQGGLRRHWAKLIDWLMAAGKDGYQRAAVENERLRIESGLAFNPTGEAAKETADAFPLMIAADDWALLEQGVIQRARMMEAVLADIYGPRTLLRDGVLPPGIVFGSGSFAPYCDAWPTPPDPWLYFYEVDLARGADGRWMILADRLDSALGDGWMFANRIAASQAFAEPFVDIGPRRLAGHYTAFQEYLESLAGPQGRLALLTPGEDDPRYFSHAYLARYLGATLIEPRDVTVRDGAAYLKTLDGLKSVDVMLRGVRERHVEALFRPASAALGAPALSLATRSGRLKLANALGSSTVAYRALAPFAHKLAEHLLGERLMIADGPCLWLGDPAAREQVLAEPGFWRIEALTGSLYARQVPRLAHRHRDALARRLAREGDRFVAVATPPLSTTPSWRTEALAPRQWMLRVFSSRLEGGAWGVAPGGVASVVDPGCPPPPLAFGKDVWVEADVTPPLHNGSMIASQLATAHRRRTGNELLSRVADDLYWIGRSAERAETTLRAMRLCLTRTLYGLGVDGRPEVLCDIIGTRVDLDETLEGRARFQDAVNRLASDPDELYGIPSVMGALRAAGQRAQGYLSEESWRCIDQVTADQRWRLPPDSRFPAQLVRLIDETLMVLAAFAGTTQENHTRNHAWRFLEMGRRLSRGLAITRAAKELIGNVHDIEETYLRAWLSLCDSRTAYRTRYMTTAAPTPAIDLLILDETNPRALAYQLIRLEEVLAALPNPGPHRRQEHKIAMQVLMDVRVADAEELAAVDDHGRRPALTALADNTNARLFDISDLVGRAFFAHAEPPATIVGTGRRQP